MYTLENLRLKSSRSSIFKPCLVQRKSVKVLTTIMTKNIKRSLLVIETILLLILFIIYYFALPLKVKNLVHIPQGSVSKIITYLREKEGIAVPSFDKFSMRLFGQPQSGWIDLGKPVLSKADLLYRLCHSKAAVKSITLLPGETKFFFLKNLSATFDLNETKLNAYYDQYIPLAEGYIIPDTYNIPLGLNEQRIMEVLYHMSRKQHKRLALKFLGVYNQNQWFRYLRAASVIQKEAANVKEMPLVSSVIYNRLKQHMRLQMDGTLNYGKYSHQKVTPYRIRNDKSRFNTYKYKGLPYIPVCAVSSQAIEAAINPAKSDYLYFMKNKKDVHDFTRYYSTHRKNIANVNK